MRSDFQNSGSEKSRWKLSSPVILVGSPEMSRAFVKASRKHRISGTKKNTSSMTMAGAVKLNPTQECVCALDGGRVLLREVVVRGATVVVIRTPE